MKTTRLAAVAILFLVLSSFRSDKLPKTYRKLLERAEMEFIMPVGLEETKPIENRQMNYEYALKVPGKKLEVRYAVRPMDKFLKSYEDFEKNKKEGDIMIHPNKLYTSLMQATLMNISGGQLPEIDAFDPDAVKEEFNADWGATAFVPLEKEFGQDYQYCLMVALHKDNKGDAYYFYMSDTQEGFTELMSSAFHSMRFKN